MLWRVRNLFGGLLATRAGLVSAYALLIGTLVVSAALSASLSAQWIARAAPAFLHAAVDQRAAAERKPTDVPQVKGRVLLTQDAFHEMILSKGYWSRRQTSRPAPAPVAPRFGPRGLQPFGLGGPDRDFDDPREGNGEPTFRTVCVRLCDGYFWPISFSTRRENFGRDQDACQSTCRSPAKLYIYRNPGEEPVDMRSTDGEPYARLPAANLYRTTYVAACTCKPQPWEHEALERHRVYALETASRKGDKSALAELDGIRAKAEAGRRLKLMLRRIITGSQQGAKAARSTRPITVSGRKLPPAERPTETAAVVAAPAGDQGQTKADRPAITTMQLGVSPDPRGATWRRDLRQSRWATRNQSVR